MRSIFLFFLLSNYILGGVIDVEINGFSNNPKVFGKLSFEDANFELNDYKNVTIEVNY